MRWIVPAQAQHDELLDTENIDRAMIRDNLREMALADRWLGDQRAVIRRVLGWIEALPRTPRVLDVATGGAALPQALARSCARVGRSVELIAGDRHAGVLAVAQELLADRPIALVRHDALALPFADGSIDIVTCTQALHHFRRDDAVRLLKEMARVARIGVIVTDLRRHVLAYWGARLLAIGPITALGRHDGPLSVLRAYTPEEIRSIVRHTALPATVRRTPGFRVEVVLDRQRGPASAEQDGRRAKGWTMATKRQKQSAKEETMAATPDTTEQYAGLSHEQLIDMYRQMVLIRVFEEKCQEMYTRAKIGGFLHLYVGQEAVAVGTIAALKPEDHIITHYRDHGHAIARGLDVNPLMAELFGKETGSAHGLGGSMHLVDVSKNFWGGYAIVGSHLLMACGIGTALKLQKRPEVIVVYFGDGATNGGEFYEAMNFAQLSKLPVVFVCENNLYAMGTPIEVHTAVKEIYRKACAFDMTSERVDGNDLIATYEAAQRAVEHARSGQGPVLLECVTYRFRGHSAQDTQKYRTKEDIEKYRSRDPNQVFRKRLIDDGILTEEQAKQIEQDVDQQIDAAVQFADESPEANEKWLQLETAYANPISDKY